MNEERCGGCKCAAALDLSLFPPQVIGLTLTARAAAFFIRSCTTKLAKSAFEKRIWAEPVGMSRSTMFLWLTSAA